MPPSLSTLPPEVFRCILARIEPPTKCYPEFSDVAANIKAQATLRNLAQCSRQFHIWTIPSLYHHVTIHEEKRQDERQSSQLRSLASLLIQRPDLAGLVRNLTFKGVSQELQYWDSLEESERPEDSENSEIFEESEEDSEHSQTLEESEEPGQDVIPEILEVDQVFKTAVNALRLSEEEESYWLRRLGQTQGCHPDLILALLLPALLKVKGVFLAMNVGFDTRYLEKVIGRAARREKPFDIQPAFEALKVFFHPTIYFNGRSPGFIASLLKLPALRVLSVCCGNNPEDVPSEDNNLKELDSHSSRLVNLSLRAYGLSTADIGRMLRAPKALKTFLYTLTPWDTSFTDIRHALGPQEHSLEDLGFALSYNEEYDVFLSYGGGYGGSDSGEDFEPMVSFIGFNTLQIFEIPSVFIQKTVNGTERHRLINIFPPNLKTLYLTRCDVGCESLLEAVQYLLVQVSPQQLPFLNELVLVESMMSKTNGSLWRDTHETAIESLTMVAAARDICVKFEDY